VAILGALVCCSAAPGNSRAAVGAHAPQRGNAGAFSGPKARGQGLVTPCQRLKTLCSRTYNLFKMKDFYGRFFLFLINHSKQAVYIENLAKTDFKQIFQMNL